MSIEKEKKKVKKAYNTLKEELIIRDHLAFDRTALANERTYLSYIRTALAFAAGGFGLVKFTPTIGLIVTGWILFSIGIIILIIGTIRFIQFRRTIGSLGCQTLIDKSGDKSKQTDDIKNDEGV